MKTKSLSLIIAGLMLCSTACKKNLDVTPPASVDVYVAGFVNAHYNEAAYWKNGVLTRLTDSPAFSIARSIAVQGNDVYLAGTVTSANFTVNNAVYWKNGVATTLDNVSPNSDAWGIAVSGSDVYVVGSVFNNSTQSLEATVWKNGVATMLPGGYIAKAIAINGNDVYIAGAGNINNSVATYWKNGTLSTLSDGFDAYAIAINGADVYIGGVTPNGGALYWKNGAANMLTNGAANATVSSVRGITVSGGNVYVAGSEPDNDNGSVLTLWKNDVPTILQAPTSIASNPSNNLATAVSVFGSDVYATGQVLNNSTHQYASYYWKNGAPVQLSDGGNNGAFAYDIVVVPK